MGVLLIYKQVVTRVSSGKKLIGVCLKVDGVTVKVRTESVGDGGRRSYDAIKVTTTKLARRIGTVIGTEQESNLGQT